MPTFLPGWCLVPRWRTMMLPAMAFCPPKSFTPSRFECDSRPLSVLPAPFLCAMAYGMSCGRACHPERRGLLLIVLLGGSFLGRGFFRGGLLGGGLLRSGLLGSSLGLGGLGLRGHRAGLLHRNRLGLVGRGRALGGVELLTLAQDRFDPQLGDGLTVTVQGLVPFAALLLEHQHFVAFAVGQHLGGD